MEIPREGTSRGVYVAQCSATLIYPRHIHSQVCKLGAEQRTQWDLAIAVALALRKLFAIEGGLLEKIDLFQYLGQILAQDNDVVRAVRNQVKKERGI